MNGASEARGARMTEQVAVQRGSTFTVEVPVSQTIDQIREEARTQYGRDVHIRAKIGPFRQDGDRLRCPLKAIDDPCLLGSIARWPRQLGTYVLIGYFK